MSESNRRMCPECDGAGGYWHSPHTQICGTLEDGCDCPEDWRTCRECRGRGTVDEIQLAIYHARGGSAPTQIQGFA